MRPLVEIKGTGDLSGLEILTRGNVRLLWHHDFYDGPISGMLLYKGAKCWFDMISEDPRTGARQFAIVELTPKQLRREEYWHELFSQKVGIHTDYDEDGRRSFMGPQPPSSMHAEFYEPFEEEMRNKPMDYSGNNVLAGFID